MILRIKNVDYTVAYSGLSLRHSVGAGGKHETQAPSFKILEKSLLNVLLTETDDLDAQVYEDNNLLFTGVVRPYATASAKNVVVDPISVEVLDYTEKMHIRVYDADADILDGDYSGIVLEQEWNGIVISDPENTSNSLIHKICDLCGVTLDSDVPTINITLHRFSLKKGNYLDEVFAEVLYEYLYDFTFTADGKLKIFSTDPKTESIGSITKFVGNLQIQRSDSTKDGVVVTYPLYKTATHKLIKEVTLADGWATIFTYTNIFDHEETYYTWDDPNLDGNNNSDVNEIYYSNFQTEGWTSGWVAGSPTITLRDPDDDGGYVSTSGYGAIGGIFGTWKYGFRIYADCSYLLESKQTKGYSGTDSETIDLSYVLDNENAIAFAEAAKSRQAYSKYTYSFKSFADFAPGSVYEMKESHLTGLSGKVRILSKTRTDDTGLYSYKAEGFGAVEFTEPDLDKDDDIDVPEDGSDLPFFEMDATKASFLAEESSSAQTIIRVSGTAFTRYGATPIWSFNGTTVTSDYTNALIITKDQLSLGINTVKCTIVVNETQYEKEITVTLIQAGSYSEFQYTVTDTAEEPGDDAVWSTTKPASTSTQYVWMRMRVDSDSDWIVIRISSPTSHDFTISFDRDFYENSLRRASNLTIAVSVTLENISSPTITYELVDPADGVGIAENVITILPGYIPESITVKVTLSGSYSGSKTATIYGVAASDNSPIYHGIFTEESSLPQSDDTTLLLYGDCAVVEYATTGYRAAYYYDGTEWQLADANTPSDIASFILYSCLYDLVGYSDSSQETIGTLFTQNLASDIAFINKLYANRIEVSGSDDSTNGLYCYSESSSGIKTLMAYLLWNGTAYFGGNTTLSNDVLETVLNTTTSSTYTLKAKSSTAYYSQGELTDALLEAAALGPYASTGEESDLGVGEKTFTTAATIGSTTYTGIGFSLASKPYLKKADGSVYYLPYLEDFFSFSSETFSFPDYSLYFNSSTKSIDVYYKYGFYNSSGSAVTLPSAGYVDFTYATGTLYGVKVSGSIYPSSVRISTSTLSLVNSTTIVVGSTQYDYSASYFKSGTSMSFRAVAKSKGLSVKNIYPKTTESYNLGAANLLFNYIYGKYLYATSALYTNTIKPVSGTEITFDCDSLSFSNSKFDLSAYNFTTNVADSGAAYVKFKNGLILQWGKTSNYSDGSSVSITYPTAFSSSNSYVLVGGLVAGIASRTYEHMNFTSHSSTGFSFYTYDDYACHWLAVGY